MKKSLIALAVLAASGAAMAQSSVTLFGRVDAYLSSKSVTDNVNGVAELTQTGLTNGGLTGSRWGMTGTEDLGGGLKAMFKLENRFSIDDGTSVGGFSGDAFVALGGGFGTLKLGRTYTAFDDARALSNSSNVFDSSFTPAVFGGVTVKAPVIPVTTTFAPDYVSRGANGVRYESPSFSGFSGAVSYAFGENKTATVDAGSIVSLNLMYAKGPLKVAYGYQDEKTQNTALTGTNSTKFHQLSAAYDFGMASVSAGYERRNGTAASGDDKGYNIGVNVPVGAALNLSAGYARENLEIAGTDMGKATGFGLGATYNMSKRTILYAGMSENKWDDSTGAQAYKARLYGMGVRHNF